MVLTQDRRTTIQAPHLTTADSIAAPTLQLLMAAFMAAGVAMVVAGAEETEVRKPIALFSKGDREPNPAFVGTVTPGQALIASALFLAMSVWALLTVLLGRPTSWFGQFVFCFCATLPVVASPTLCVLGFIDAVRRRGDPRWIATFVLSLVGVAATAAFFYLVIYPSDGA